jgi:predicted naringenin-chalcone synthase
MSAFLHSIATRAPDQPFAQSYIRDRMIDWVDDPVTRRKIRYVYDRSGIDTRHSVVRDFLPGAEPELFRTDGEGRLIEPTTQQRNRLYIRHAPELAVGAARDALHQADGISATDVTHLITASCTGFYNPGPDFDIVTQLGLADSTERYHLGFMGCYAAFPALRMAQQFCTANPEAVVLVVCIEMCSLHLQLRNDDDSLLGNALFADGAAAVVVSARPPAPSTSHFALDQFVTAIAPDSTGDMAWEIGDRGFNLVLSSYVPKVIGANIGAIVDDALVRTGRNRDDIATWAIHPGGKSILDHVATRLGLADEQIQPSREILRTYGNMSSPTILFVLRRILDASETTQSQTVFAAAFGPGLTIETATLEYVPSTRPSLTTAKNA